MTIWLLYPPDHWPLDSIPELPGMKLVDGQLDDLDLNRLPIEREDVLVPLCEELVVPANVEATRTGALAPGLATTDRRLLRRKLRPELSPAWAVDRLPGSPGPWYVKAPASTLSEGVSKMFRGRQLRDQSQKVWRRNSLLNSLLERGWDPGYQAMVEEFVDGPQWEVSGVASGGQGAIFGAPIRQRWRGRSIIRYEADPNAPARLCKAALQAVEDLGLDRCAFCIEMRVREDGQPVVIDAHCRPGEEQPHLDSQKGYTDALGPDFPRKVIEALAQGSGIAVAS